MAVKEFKDIENVSSVSTETKNNIKKKSVLTTGTNPSEKGMTAQKIKEAMVTPVIDTKDSAISEIDRVIEKINSIVAELNEVLKNHNDSFVATVSGDFSSDRLTIALSTKDKETMLGSIYIPLSEKANKTIKINGYDLSNDITLTKEDIGLGKVANVGLDMLPSAESDNVVQSGGIKFYVDDCINIVIERLKGTNEDDGTSETIKGAKRYTEGYTDSLVGSPNNLKTIDKSNIVNSINELKTRVDERTSALSFKTKQEMLEKLAESPERYVVGTSIYLEETGVDDYWISEVIEKSDFEYEGEDGIINLPYKLMPLESDTPDLVNYYTKDEVENRVSVYDEKTQIINSSGDGGKFLANDGTYKTESDPTVPDHVKKITEGDISNWDNYKSRLDSQQTVIEDSAKSISENTSSIEKLDNKLDLNLLRYWQMRIRYIEEYTNFAGLDSAFDEAPILNQEDTYITPKHLRHYEFLTNHYNRWGWLKDFMIQQRKDCEENDDILISFLNGNETMWLYEVCAFLDQTQVDFYPYSSNYMGVEENYFYQPESIIKDHTRALNYHANMFNNKVDKVSGKALSTNDFTDAYKNNVNSNTSARHTHSNQSILNQTTEAYTTAEKTKVKNSNKEISLYFDRGYRAGRYGPIDICLNPFLGSNCFAYFPPSAMTVEYSRDDGATWLDYGASDREKTWLTSLNNRLYGLILGKATINSENSTKNKLRITFNCLKGQLYARILKLAIAVSINGSSSCSYNIEIKSAYNYYNGIDEWTTIGSNIPVDGWIHWNTLNVTEFLTTAQNSANQSTTEYTEIRFTFSQGSVNNNYTGLIILNIFAYAGLTYNTTNYMSKHGHLYDFDINQKMILPADLDVLNGKISTKANTYAKLAEETTQFPNGALNLEFSNIYGVKSLIFADLCEYANEGIQFYNNGSTYDVLRGKTGKLIWTPSRAKGTYGTDYEVLTEQHKGVANGVASLDSNGKVAQEQLPTSQFKELFGTQEEPIVLSTLENGVYTIGGCYKVLPSQTEYAELFSKYFMLVHSETYEGNDGFIRVIIYRDIKICYYNIYGDRFSFYVFQIPYSQEDNWKIN